MNKDYLIEYVATFKIVVHVQASSSVDAKNIAIRDTLVKPGTVWNCGNKAITGFDVPKEPTRIRVNHIKDK